jgi:putative hydrolase of the HAD superfamily
LSFREAIGEITSALGCPADELTLQHICEERLRVKAEPFLEIEDPVLSMIDHFRARGLRLGVVSNCLAEDAAAWPNCSLASRFDCAVFSFEVGLAKPNPDIYIEASRRLQIDASDTWYIGDGADEELSGAAEAGVRPFRATWFLRRWPHFRDEPGSIAHVDATTDFVNLVERALARTAEAISVSL